MNILLKQTQTCNFIIFVLCLGSIAFAQDSYEDETTTESTGFLDYEFTEEQKTLFSLCPELLDAPMQVAQESRYDNETSKCYVLGSYKHCQNMMEFKDVDDIYGNCACYTNHKRPLLFDSATNQCYNVYTQGYCNETEWIVAGPNRQPTCAPNPCFTNPEGKEDDSDSPLLSFHGRCVQLGSLQPECKEDEVIIIDERSFNIKCDRSPNGAGGSGGGVIAEIPNNCPPGSYLTVKRKCQTGMKWDKV